MTTPQRKPTISDYTDLTKVCHKWRISTWRQPLQPLQPWTSVESRTHRWAPETDLQWGPRHLDIHRGKTPGTSGPLTLWLCCSWNKLLIRLAGGELAPRLSLVSPKVFSPFCHRWSFRFLPLSPLACLSKSNQIKSLLLSHHHSTSALVSEILMSVLQTVQKNNRQFTYGQTVQKNNKQFTYGQTVQKNNKQFTYGQTVQKNNKQFTYAYRTLLPGFWLEPENLSISHQSSGPYTGFQLHLGSILKYFYSFISRSMA